MCVSVLTLRNVSAGYRDGELVVLRGVSVTADEGRITALVGKNAVGKSTLFRGLFNSCGAWLDGEEISWYGRPVPHLRKGVPVSDVAWMQQEPRPVFPRMTVRDGLKSALVGDKYNGWSTRWRDLWGGLRNDIAADLDWVLQRMPELTARPTRASDDESKGRGFPLIEKQMQVLSGGERTLVALAMALINRPKLLCLDEPVATLDQQRNRPRVKEIIREYVSEFQAACLLIEHDESTLSGLADTIVQLNEREFLAPSIPAI